MGTFVDKAQPSLGSAPRKPVSSDPFSVVRVPDADSILYLQRTVGNQAVLRLLKTRTSAAESLPRVKTTQPAHGPNRAAPASKPLHPLQTKLVVNTPGDVFEQEADRIAEQVVGMPEPRLQRACACGGECSECQAQQLERAPERLQPMSVESGDAGEAVAPPIVGEVLRSPGQPLDPVTRAFFEPRFGHGFDQVRVHTDAAAYESAEAVGAHAYTVGHQIVFGEGQYAPGTSDGTKLIAHELTHVVQQGASSKATAQVDRAEEDGGGVGDGLFNPRIAPRSIARSFASLPSTMSLQRQPKTTPVRVDATGWSAFWQLRQGGGSSGAVVYEYTAQAMREPPDVNDVKKPGQTFEINLPLLIYPPSTLDLPKIDIFVFFHGMRATYEEGTNRQKSQGSEPIALWSHLKEAVAGTDRLGIAPQAPATWGLDRTGTKWVPTTAQWNEALGKVGFEGLINIALDRLTSDLGLDIPLVPGEIHVAGHSAGGKGIIEATSRDAGAKSFADQVQDVTLQDAGYGFSHWDHVVDWFLDGSPGKTVRVLVSQDEGGTPDAPGSTRSVLSSSFNVDKINASIKKKAKSDTLDAAAVAVPKPEDQKPRPGGFVLESQLVVNNKKTGGTQATILVFFAPGGGHYETVTASMGAAAAAGAKTTTDFLDEAKPGNYRVISSEAEVFKDEALSEHIPQDKKASKLVLPRDAVVEVISMELKKPGKKDTGTQPYIANVKTADGVVGWMRMSSLAGQ
jgi:Domain of unknown function (DUF4157)